MSFVLWAKRNRMFTMLLSWNAHKIALVGRLKIGWHFNSTQHVQTRLQFKFPHGNYDFLVFLSAGERKTNSGSNSTIIITTTTATKWMNCEKFHSLVLLWLVCKQVDVISYTHALTHTNALCQRSSQQYLYTRISYCFWIWIGAFYLRTIELHMCVCTVQHAIIQFGFCGWFFPSHNFECTCMFFPLKLFPTILIVPTTSASVDLFLYNRLKAT